MRGQVIAILGAVSFAYYAYYYFDHFHYHVTRGYAHLGYPEAQHIVGQKLLYGACYKLNLLNNSLYYTEVYLSSVLTFRSRDLMLLLNLLFFWEGGASPKKPKVLLFQIRLG